MPIVKAPALDRSSSEQAIHLLDAATAHVLQNGLGDLSLRSMADALGTSHRMLIYYFGSADGFWEALLFRVRRAEQQAREDMHIEGLAPDAALAAAWERYSAPNYLPIMQLLFEIYGRAIRDRERFSGFLDDVVGSWTSVVAQRLEQGMNVDPQEARLIARVEVATIRGLLLDLITTGDRAGTTAALQYFARKLVQPAKPGQPKKAR
ncbi:TetR/AcrR family transcriptional regulator [Paracidovorax citrulli]